METIRFCFFSFSREIQVERNTKSFKKEEFIFFITTVHYSKWNLVLHVKSYGSKFSDGRRKLRTFTKQRSVRSLKEMMPYDNKQLTKLTTQICQL